MCACMVLSKKVGQKLLSQLVGNQPYMVHKRAKQWILLDLWIQSFFSNNPGTLMLSLQKFSTMHAALVPLGLAQIDPGLAGICFAMQNPRLRMACHCVAQVFSCLLCAWQWHLLEFWRLHCDVVVHLVLLAVLGVPKWPDLAASHIGCPWLVASSWFKAG